MACAQCHTHKYDPITQEEYFKVFAILNNTEDADRRDESPLHSLLTESQRRDQQQWQQQLTTLESEVQTSTPELDADQAAWEASVPAQFGWQTLVPSQATSKAGSEVTVEDSVIRVAKGGKVDDYQITAPITSKLRAIRIETLPDASLPAGGPGYGGGNFVITDVKASVQPLVSKPIEGRYIRIEIPGKDKMLSLAEVQVFKQDQNIALQGVAKQSSTGFSGPAELAIDGNTNGPLHGKRNRPPTPRSPQIPGGNLISNHLPLSIDW